MVIELPNRRATRQLGAAIAAHLVRGDIVWLEGELGAGKTFLARAILRGLGVPPRVPVTSPTFALVHELEGRVPIRHLDLYRLIDAGELVQLGIHEWLEDSVTVIEWGARFRDAIGQRGLEVHLSIPDGRPNARVARLTGLGARGRQLAHLAAGGGL